MHCCIDHKISHGLHQIPAYKLEVLAMPDVRFDLVHSTGCGLTVMS